MPSSRCVVQNCSNRGDNIAGISMHYCALSAAERPKWIRFVHLHRANFNPKGIFPVCSAHFAPDCFQRAVHIPGQQRKILPGSVPTIWKTAPTDEGISARSRRKVSGLSAIILNSIINNYNFRGHCDLFWG